MVPVVTMTAEAMKFKQEIKHLGYISLIVSTLGPCDLDET